MSVFCRYKFRGETLKLAKSKNEGITISILQKEKSGDKTAFSFRFAAAYSSCALSDVKAPKTFPAIYQTERDTIKPRLTEMRDGCEAAFFPLLDVSASLFICKSAYPSRLKRRRYKCRFPYRFFRNNRSFRFQLPFRCRKADTERLPRNGRV